MTEAQVRALSERDRALFGGGEVKSHLPALNASLEQEQYGRLLPGYVRRFVETAAPLIDLKLEGDPDGVFDLVPLRPRGLDPVLSGIEFYPTEMRGRFTVYRPLDPAAAIWMHPGEPVFDHFCEALLSRRGGEARSGAIFIDPHTKEPYLFHLAEVSVLRLRPAAESAGLFLNGPIEAGGLDPEMIETRLIGLRQETDGSITPLPLEHLLLLRGAASTAPGSVPLAGLARGLVATADKWIRSDALVGMVEAHRARLARTLPERLDWTLFGLGADFDSAFKEPLGPKWSPETNDGELVDQPGRFANNGAASKEAYETGMAAVFGKCYAALAPEGRLILVFANKNPNAWETLVSALIRAGFVVDASWPIRTERGARTNAITTASLASSVWLVCKKRSPARPGWDTGVLAEMRGRIHAQLRAFWDAGIRGPDFVWAATGPALEAYSKYPVVKKANAPDGLMTVSEFLREVRRLVVDFVVARVLSQGGDGSEEVASLEDVTTYYLLHRNDFGLDDAPIGACILYALSCNLSDSELTDGFDVLTRSGRDLFEQDEEADEEGEADEEDNDIGGKGNKVKLKPWNQRRGRMLGLEAPGGGRRR